MAQTKKVKNTLVKVAEALDKFLASEASYGRKPRSVSFTNWYLETNHKDSPRETVHNVDGSGDGGIDAIVKVDDQWNVYQMKYAESASVPNLEKRSVNAFEDIARLFLTADQDEFDVWLEDVTGRERQVLYKKVRRVAQRRPDAVRFALVTTKRSTRSSSLIDIVTAQRVFNLWVLDQQGFTPAVSSIRLKFKPGQFVNARSPNTPQNIIGIADINQLVRAFETHGERLLAQNVRTDLGTTINDQIRETYEDQASEFLLGNNGIYIVCSSVQQDSSEFELFLPSIINGSQTIHSIAHSSKRRKPVQVVMRILVVSDASEKNRAILDRVIRRTNSQNRMKPANLVAHERRQRKIGRFLHDFAVYYERREKEWSNSRSMYGGYVHTTSSNLAKWLAAIRDVELMARARTNVSQLFEDRDLYLRIFEPFDEDPFSRRRKRELVVAVWAGLFIAGSKKQYIRPDLLEKAQLLFVRALWQAAGSDTDSYDAIRQALDEHRFGKKHVPPAFVGFVNQCLRDILSIFNKAKKRDPNLDESGFFKGRERVIDAYRDVFDQDRIMRLRRYLTASLGKMT